MTASAWLNACVKTLEKADLIVSVST